MFRVEFMSGKWNHLAALVLMLLVNLPSFAEQETVEDVARLNQQIGEIMRWGKIAEAITIAQKIVEIQRHLHGKKSEDYANSVEHLARLYGYTKDQKGAEVAAYEEVLEIRSGLRPRNDSAYIRVLERLADLYKSDGQYEKAESLFKELLIICEKAQGERLRDYLQALNALVSLYETEHRPSEAAPLRTRAREISEYIQQSLAEATRLNEDAVKLIYRMDYDAALPLLQRALEIREGLQDPSYQVTLENLAVLYTDFGQYEKAETVFNRLLSTRRSPDPRLMCNLAELYTWTGKYEEAERLYATALKEIEKGDLHRLGAFDNAAALSGLAVLYEKTGREQQSRVTFQRALQAEDADLDWVFSFNSEQDMQDRLEIFRSTLDQVVGLALTEGSHDPALTEAVALWIVNRKCVVLDAIARLEREQRSLVNDSNWAPLESERKKLTQHLHDLTLSPPQGVDAVDIQREYSATEAKLKETETLLNYVAAHRDSFATTPTMMPVTEVELGSVHNGLPPGSALVDFLVSSRFDFRATTRVGSWKSAHYVAVVIRRDAPPRLLDLGEAEEIEELIADVRKNIERFGALNDESSWQAEERVAEAAFQVASANLYDALFRRTGLREAVGSAHTIYVSPDGELNRIAFEALVDRQSAKTGKQQTAYLAESRSFVYLPAGREFLQSHGELGNGTVVFAGPDFNMGIDERKSVAKTLLAKAQNKPAPAVGSAASREIRGLRWDPLQGATDESADVKKILGGTKYGPVRTYEGKEALEEVFLAVHSPRVLHVATHGYFLKNQKMDPEDREGLMHLPPSAETGAARGQDRLRGAENPLLRSGLIFAGANLVGSAGTEKVGDGWVTAEDVSQMDLQGTDLVILSACETGLGDVKLGAGVQGLQRAFLLAGARSLVMSLYKVPDAESRELMRQFYQQLKRGDSKASALRNAQLQMIKKRRAANGAAHPFFWGSFVFIGNPD